MSARILVVDDNPLNVKLLAAKLAHDYYIVSMAENGLQALEKTAAEKPDIILLDVMMPEMDGFEACRQLKANPATKHIPVVMVTALSDVADRVRGLEAGADDFLTKPINDVALMARVRSLLRLKMIMDEWRSRETTSNQFSLPSPGEDADLAVYAGGHIVLLEDSAAERKMIVNTLSSVGVRATFAGTITEAVTIAKTGDCDLVMVSLDLRGEDGLQICPQLRTQDTTRQLPILLLASEGDIPRVAKGLDLGANDYLLRPLDANELLARVRTQLRQKRHYERLRANYEQSLTLALVDPLTGAFNRRYLEAHLPKLIARCRSADKPLSVLLIDADHFKQVNDTHGHAVGDVVLREVVNRTMLGLRPFDLVARIGGEEFVVVMPETDIKAALAIGERLRERIAATPIGMPGKNVTVPITVSIGATSMMTENQDNYQMILERADAGLYQAKNNGRNRVAVA